jgi:hypothetical protein
LLVLGVIGAVIGFSEGLERSGEEGGSQRNVMEGWNMMGKQAVSSKRGVGGILGIWRSLG